MPLEGHSQKMTMAIKQRKLGWDEDFKKCVARCSLLHLLILGQLAFMAFLPIGYDNKMVFHHIKYKIIHRCLCACSWYLSCSLCGPTEVKLQTRGNKMETGGRN